MPNSDYKDIKIFAGHRKNGATICNIYFFCEKKMRERPVKTNMMLEYV